MTVTTIINGTIKIVLTPETDVEKTVLAQFRSGAISMEKATENYIVANKPLPDSVILTNVKEETSK